jgi:ankyrin repeat protein
MVVFLSLSCKKTVSFEKLSLEEQAVLKKNFLESVSLRDDEDYQSTIIYLSKGVPVNSRNTNGFPATHIAIVNHNPQITMYLLEHGADVNATDPDSATMLHYAAGAGYPSIVKYLIDHGAYVDARAVHNLTPALYASELWGDISSDSLKLIVHYLTDAGSDPNAIDDMGNNIFLRAVLGTTNDRHDLPTIFDDGFKNGGLCYWPGIRVEGKGESGYCDIAIALKMLLDKGGSPDMKNNNGLSARMYVEKVFREEFKSQGGMLDSATMITQPFHAELYLFKNNLISPACHEGVSIQ